MKSAAGCQDPSDRHNRFTRRLGEPDLWEYSTAAFDPRSATAHTQEDHPRMNLCEQCALLPNRADALPADSATAHLAQERRVGPSTPHFPKKYVRECPTCQARWGIAHLSSWDSRWVLLDQEKP